ncbi:Translation elongation factor Ts [Candidatus Chazhemtobacterium aquaticus]|uniref:Elongation factor Ts n=2 Tax=Candidatus Chazhemtobacterium aquaticus TaxID=2715735 RepID=A0A857N6J2_9BACT|nr:translation elongation factor Ts [Candidatus Chazhemtobacterium aquaticus]QHO63746.1 Translation elongation factor Ts [Candidatus Chazhemtobacterium aquaticus]
MMEKIKQLREKTGAGVMDAKKALEESGGDMKKAEEIIAAKGIVKAEKKADREVKSGLVYGYTHQGRVGVLVEVSCETDFVAKNPEFEALCKEVALQVASMEPKDVEELLEQDYIRDGGKKIKDLVTNLIGKIGENIQVRRFVRFELGGE